MAQIFLNSNEKDIFTKSPSLLGPYRILFQVLLIGLLILSLSRLGLVVWQWDRVSAAIDLPSLFIQGLRADLIIMGMLIAPLMLLMPLLVNKLTWQLWQKLVWFWSLMIIVLIIFMESATPTFIVQYDLRPNRLFVEYLQYPKEVFSTLWEGFRLPLILGVVFTILAGLFTNRLLQHWLKQYHLDWPVWRVWLTWPLMVLILVVMIRSTLSHRPANPAMFAITSDAMVNSLVINSTWSVYFAIRRISWWRVFCNTRIGKTEK